jgi:hypothetical protein
LRHGILVVLLESQGLLDLFYANGLVAFNVPAIVFAGKKATTRSENLMIYTLGNLVLLCAVQNRSVLWAGLSDKIAVTLVATVLIGALSFAKENIVWT